MVQGRTGDGEVGRRRGSSLGLAVLGIGFLALVASQWQGRQKVGAVVVTGATGLSATAVHHVVDSLRSRSLASISFADVRMMVERLPYVRSASVFVTAPGALTVDVVERLPVAHLVLPSGELRFIDADGRVLPAVDVHVGHNVPLVQNDAGAVFSDADLKRIAAMVVAASSTLDPVLYQSVSEFRYLPSSSLVIVTNDVRWTMDVRSPERATALFADMNVFWRETASTIDMVAVKEFDLRWDHQIVVRYRDGIIHS